MDANHKYFYAGTHLATVKQDAEDALKALEEGRDWNAVTRLRRMLQETAEAMEAVFLVAKKEKDQALHETGRRL